MVLEGLRRAECFVGLLRRLGYQREDGRPSKPEHFDQEFGSRQYGAALCDLLTALQARTLTDEEVARLEHLARLGLLDGLIEEENVAVEVQDYRQDLQGEDEVRRLSELVEDYENELRVLEERVSSMLKMMDKDDINLLVECPPICPPLGHDFDEPQTTLEEGILKDNLSLNDQLDKLIASKLKDLSSPIDNHSIEDPMYRFGSVRNEDLIKCAWHPDDYDFYSMKIDKYIEIIRQELGLELHKSEVVQDEFVLARLRTVYQQAIIQTLCRFETELIFLNRLLVAICQRYTEGWGRILQDTTLAQLQELIGAMEDHIQGVRAPTLYCRPQSASAGLEFNGDLSYRYEQLLHNFATAKQIIGRLASEQGEISLISPSASSLEAQARAISMELSTLLQSTLTESKRLELLVKEEK